jgi:hypothetical protein
MAKRKLKISILDVISGYSVSQSWPDDELPFFTSITLNATEAMRRRLPDATSSGGASNLNATFEEWQLDIPVVMFGFGYCVTCVLILVQVILILLLW